MKFNLINQLGDWNPQLLRELKGRLQPRNAWLATLISLFGQFIIVLSFQIQLPTHSVGLQYYTNKYCTGVDKSYYEEPLCLKDGFDNFIINWQLWSLDIFTSLSLIGCFTLLVAGSYLLINDLAKEEKRQTLNFIRLSPQSPQSILSGKILGVPILLYLVIFLAVPLHLWLGFSAKIPLISILSFYTDVVATCFLYYNGSLLFGLVGSWLGGFQAWLGSGVVLGFLFLTHKAIIREMPDDYPLIILRLFNPSNLTPHSALGDSSTFAKFHWFSLPLGESFFTTVGFSLLINGLGTYCIWQSLQRCFRDESATILSKKQSYLLTSGFALITIGCANWQELVLKEFPRPQLLYENFVCLFLLDFGLFLYLIMALNPHRQTLQDWARYRKIYSYQQLGDGKLVKDLIWGEKSPGLLAIALNAMIAITSLSIFILLCHVPLDYKLPAFFSLALAGSLAMLYAALAQLVLLMKNQHRVFWATGIVGAAIVLPAIIVAMFSSYANHNSFLWLFSIAAPILVISPDGKSLSAMTLFVAIISHWTIAGLLLFQLTRQLKKAGESATKALLKAG
jgi:hypothetical protein